MFLKKRNKNFFNFIKLALITFFTVPMMANACTDEDILFELQQQSFFESKFDTNNYFIRDAIIHRWVDGDTLIVEFTDENELRIGEDTGKITGEGAVEITNDETNTNLRAIRFSFIDTPEVNIPGKEIDPEEKKWGEKASAFAKKEIAVGTDVKVILNNPIQPSYNRWVGEIFYGIDYKNYSISIIEAGWAVPIVQKRNFDNSKTLEGWMSKQIRGAFNSAIKNKNGIFGGDNQNKDVDSAIKEVYKAKVPDGYQFLINN